MKERCYALAKKVLNSPKVVGPGVAPAYSHRKYPKPTWKEHVVLKPQ